MNEGNSWSLGTRGARRDEDVGHLPCVFQDRGTPLRVMSLVFSQMGEANGCPSCKRGEEAGEEQGAGRGQGLLCRNSGLRVAAQNSPKAALPEGLWQPRAVLLGNPTPQTCFPRERLASGRFSAVFFRSPCGDRGVL